LPVDWFNALLPGSAFFMPVAATNVVNQSKIGLVTEIAPGQYGFTVPTGHSGLTALRLDSDGRRSKQSVSRSQKICAF